MAEENCWWKSPWSGCRRKNCHRYRGLWTQMGSQQTGFPNTCSKYCAWGWCLMKLTGFLFYFCHIQISTELKDKAVGPKFLRIKKGEERKKKWNACEVKYLSGDHTPLHSGPFRDSPQMNVVIIWLLFSLMIYKFSISFQTYWHWSPLPLHFNLRPWGGLDNRDVFVLLWYYSVECLWSSAPLRLTWRLVFILLSGLAALLVRQEFSGSRDLERPRQQAKEWRHPSASGHVYQRSWPLLQLKIYLGLPVSWQTWESGPGKCRTRIFWYNWVSV